MGQSPVPGTPTDAPHLAYDRVTPTDGTSLRQPDLPAWLAWLAKRLLRLMGWRLYGQFPDVPKCVVIAYPHTSNLDGIIMLLVAFAYQIRPVWMVKVEWVRGPVGGLVRALGGLGIDRRGSLDTVTQAADRIRQAERIVLVIAPEGTRRKTDHLKAGFYWMAHTAGVPIVCSFMDYPHRRTGIGLTITTTGEIEADLVPVFDLYRQVVARNPEKMSDLRLRPTQQRPMQPLTSRTPDEPDR